MVVRSAERVLAQRSCGRCVGDRGVCHVVWHGAACRTEIPRGCGVPPRIVLCRSTCWSVPRSSTRLWQMCLRPWGLPRGVARRVLSNRNTTEVRSTTRHEGRSGALNGCASSRRRRPQFLQWWLLGTVHVSSVVASQLPCPVRRGEFCLQCRAWPVRLRGRCVGDRGACHVAWHGVSCRTELPRGCEVLPRPHPQVHVLQRSTCPTRLRHGAGGRLRQGAGGRLRQGVGGTARRELRAQVLICVACMVRPR